MHSDLIFCAIIKGEKFYIGKFSLLLRLQVIFKITTRMMQMSERKNEDAQNLVSSSLPRAKFFRLQK